MTGDDRTDPIWTEVRGLYFDRQGVAINLRDWVDHYEDVAYRILARANPREDLWVSTIWEGTSVHLSGAPFVFETAVFRGEPGHGGTWLTAWRSATEAQALATQAAVEAHVLRFGTCPEDLPDPESLL